MEMTRKRQRVLNIHELSKLGINTCQCLSGFVIQTGNGNACDQRNNGLVKKCVVRITAWFVLI